MKKLVKTLVTSALVLTLAVSLTACKKSGGLTIAVPNDTTNEARALLLLQEQGYITLKDGTGITATIKDIQDNPYNIPFKEVEENEASFVKKKQRRLSFPMFCRMWTMRLSIPIMRLRQS